MYTLPDRTRTSGNRNTPGRIVIERDETAEAPRCSPCGTWEIVASLDKTCSYPKTTAATQLHRIVNCWGHTLVSRLAKDTVQVLLRSVTYCHVSLRSPRFTAFYKVGHLRGTTVANFSSDLKFVPASTAVTTRYVGRYRSLTLSHGHTVSSTVVWNVAAGNIV